MGPVVWIGGSSESSYMGSGVVVMADAMCEGVELEAAGLENDAVQHKPDQH